MGEIGDRQTLSRSYISEEIELAVYCKVYESTTDSRNYVQDKNKQIHNNGNIRMYNSLEMSLYSPIEPSGSENNLQNNSRNVNTNRTEKLSNSTNEELISNNATQSQGNQHLQNGLQTTCKEYNR